MESLMKYISRTHRLAGQYRGTGVPCDGINSCQHIYIFQVCKNPGISQDQLSKLICVNKSNVTRQLSVLEQNGFVTRQPDPRDRRVLQVFSDRESFTAFSTGSIGHAGMEPPSIRRFYGGGTEILIVHAGADHREGHGNRGKRGEIVGYANDLSVLKALCAPYEPRPIHKIYWNHYGSPAPMDSLLHDR